MTGGEGSQFFNHATLSSSYFRALINFGPFRVPGYSVLLPHSEFFTHVNLRLTYTTRKSSNRTCDGRMLVEPPLLEIYRRCSESLVINLQVFSKVASKDKVRKGGV